MNTLTMLAVKILPHLAVPALLRVMLKAVTEAFDTLHSAYPLLVRKATP